MNQQHAAHIVPFDSGSASPATEPLVLRTREAARLLNLSERKVQQMCKSGELEHVYFGRALRIPRWAVLRRIPQPEEAA